MYAEGWKIFEKRDGYIWNGTRWTCFGGIEFFSFVLFFFSFLLEKFYYRTKTLKAISMLTTLWMKMFILFLCLYVFLFSIFPFFVSRLSVWYWFWFYLFPIFHSWYYYCASEHTLPPIAFPHPPILIRMKIRNDIREINIRNDDCWMKIRFNWILSVI